MATAVLPCQANVQKNLPDELLFTFSQEASVGGHFHLYYILNFQSTALKKKTQIEIRAQQFMFIRNGYKLCSWGYHSQRSLFGLANMNFLYVWKMLSVISW